MEPAPPVRTSARAMLGSGLFVAIATVAANGLNAGFQVALARILSPAEYSLLLVADRRHADRRGPAACLPGVGRA